MLVDSDLNRTNNINDEVLIVETGFLDRSLYAEKGQDQIGLFVELYSLTKMMQNLYNYTRLNYFQA